MRSMDETCIILANEAASARTNGDASIVRVESAAPLRVKRRLSSISLLATNASTLSIMVPNCPTVDNNGE